jgi:hypothetical protein
MPATKAPSHLTLDFLDADLQPICLQDLGSSFLDAAGLDTSASALRKPFRIAIERKFSQAGNAYYDYTQTGIPLPDGLRTYLRLERVVIPMGRIRPSQAGHPTREGLSEIVVGGSIYKVTAYITEGKQPFYVKVIAHKKPKSSPPKPRSRIAPRGGKLI